MKNDDDYIRLKDFKKCKETYLSTYLTKKFAEKV